MNRVGHTISARMWRLVHTPLASKSLVAHVETAWYGIRLRVVLLLKNLRSVEEDV